MGATIGFGARLAIAVLIALVAIGLGVAYHPLLFLLLIVALVAFVL